MEHAGCARFIRAERGLQNFVYQANGELRTGRAVNKTYITIHDNAVNIITGQRYVPCPTVNIIVGQRYVPCPTLSSQHEEGAHAATLSLCVAVGKEKLRIAKGADIAHVDVLHCHAGGVYIVIICHVKV